MRLHRNIAALGFGLACLLAPGSICRARQHPEPPMSGSEEMRRRMAQLDSLANPQTVRDGAEWMRFEQTRIETGRLGEDDAPSSYVYRWQNIGESPLVITRVTTSCGCAVPAYDRNPVPPGASGSITVTYHPKGHPGYFHRKISVFTQRSRQRPTAVLELSGEVIPSIRPDRAYPHAMGSLRLKQREITFAGTSPQTERIECLNAGDGVLHLSVDSLLLPPYLSVRIDPQRPAPGERCDLIIRYDPEKLAQGRQPMSVPVILRGPGLPPNQCTLQIRFATQK